MTPAERNAFALFLIADGLDEATVTLANGQRLTGAVDGMHADDAGGGSLVLLVK